MSPASEGKQPETSAGSLPLWLGTTLPGFRQRSDSFMKSSCAGLYPGMELSCSNAAVL